MKIYIKRNGKLVAYISLVRCLGGTEIEFLKVDKEYWGKGFATELLNKAKKVAGENNLVALIEPIKDSSLNYEQKKEWLIRNGFKKVAKYNLGDCIKSVMVYNPKYYKT